MRTPTLTPKEVAALLAATGYCRDIAIEHGDWDPPWDRDALRSAETKLQMRQHLRSSK